MLIENFLINPDEVIRIYDQAFIQAEKKKKSFGADEIADELAPILSDIVAQWDLKNNFQRYYRVLHDWRIPDTFKSIEQQTFESTEEKAISITALQYKCLLLIATLLTELCEAQLSHYKNISDEYKNYLSDVITKDIARISNKEKLLKICGILEINVVTDIKNIQQIISLALQKKSGQNEIIATLKKEKLVSLETIQAVKKHGVITTAVEILTGPSKDPVKKLNNFSDHLKSNKKDLIVSRDSGLKTFMKGLGVAAATIFGFGIGGYLVYQRLFCNSRGAKFMDQAEDALILQKKI